MEMIRGWEKKSRERITNMWAGKIGPTVNRRFYLAV